MSDMMPTLDFGAVAKGVDDIGNAVAYQRNLQNNRDAQAATLAVRSAWDDKLQELQQNGDFGQDWGDVARQTVSQTIDGLADQFHDQAFAANFKTAALNQYETEVPRIRAQQSVASAQYSQGLNDSSLNDANQIAQSGDVAGAMKRLDTRMEPVYNPNGQGVKFGPDFENAFRDPNGALDVGKMMQYGQAAHDQVAQSYVQGQINQILGTDAPLPQKASLLENLRQNAIPQIDNTSARISPEMKSKLQGMLDTTWQHVNLTAQSGQLDSIASDVSANWASAKVQGKAYDPAAAVKSFIDQPGVLPEVKAKGIGFIKEFTNEGKTPLGEVASKAQLDAAKDFVASLYNSGASQTDAQAAINKIFTHQIQGIDLQPGQYSELSDYASKAAKTFSQAAKPVTDAIDAQLAGYGGGDKNMVRANILESLYGYAQGGGLTEFQNPDGTVNLNQKTNDFISSVIDEAKNKHITNLISRNPFTFLGQRWDSDDKVAKDYLMATAQGKGNYEWNRSSFQIDPRTGQAASNDPIINKILMPIQSAFTKQFGPPSGTSFAVGTKMGTPEFFYQGKWYQASAAGHDDSNPFVFTEIPGPTAYAGGN